MRYGQAPFGFAGMGDGAGPIKVNKMEAQNCEIPEFRNSDHEAQEVLRAYRRIAVVGLSSQAKKPSHFVPKYLQENGYIIIPVNPRTEGAILGETVYPNLHTIPSPVDIVNIFRPPEDVSPIVEEAIIKEVKVIWMQEGIVNNAAAKRAQEAGLQVIMDRCMMRVHRTM